MVHFSSEPVVLCFRYYYPLFQVPVMSQLALVMAYIVRVLYLHENILEGWKKQTGGVGGTCL